MDIEFLLLQIDDKDENPKDAQLALGTLYEEFRRFVYNITVKNIDYVRLSTNTSLDIALSEYLIKRKRLC